jgi:endonuclease YncB( thermonuclease family)
MDRNMLVVSGQHITTAGINTPETKQIFLLDGNWRCEGSVNYRYLRLVATHWASSMNLN